MPGIIGFPQLDPGYGFGGSPPAEEQEAATRPAPMPLQPDPALEEYDARQEARIDHSDPDNDRSNAGQGESNNGSGASDGTSTFTIAESDWDETIAYADEDHVEAVAQDRVNDWVEGLTIIHAGTGDILLDVTGVVRADGSQYVGLQDYEVEALKGLPLIFVHNHTEEVGASDDDLRSALKDKGHWSWSRHWGYESYHSEVYTIRFDGSVLKRLTYNRYDENRPQWSNDGESILFDSGGLHSVSMDGGGIKRINQLSRGSYSRSHNGLLLSIDHNSTGDPALDYSLHQDSSGLKLLVIPEAPIAFYNELQWLPNDEAFFYVDEYKGVQVYNTKTLLRMDTPSLGRGPASWSPNCKWLAIIGISGKYAGHGGWIRISDEVSTDNRSRRYLYLLDMDTGQLKAFIHYIKYVPITWSPDSEWIAFVSSSNDGQLFKIKRDGTGLQQLTDLECSISEISWSPK